MMKKKMRVPIELSPSTSYFAGGEDSLARLKHHLLLQDYHELLKDIKQKEEKMQKALQWRVRLLAEVKFLREKYQKLSNSSWTLQLGLKKSRNPPDAYRKAKPRNAVMKPEQSLKKDRNQRPKVVSRQNAAPLLDLNQDVEEREIYEPGWKPLNVDELNRLSIGVDALATGVKLSICRDAGSGSNRVGNRRVSWKDQMALRV